MKNKLLGILAVGLLASPLDRLWRKQEKLEARLGPEGIKPSRMRWRTYERLLDQIDAVETAKDGVWWPQFARLVQKLGMDPDEFIAEVDGRASRSRSTDA